MTIVETTTVKRHERVDGTPFWTWSCKVCGHVTRKPYRRVNDATRVANHHNKTTRH